MVARTRMVITVASSRDFSSAEMVDSNNCRLQSRNQILSTRILVSCRDMILCPKSSRGSYALIAEMTEKELLLSIRETFVKIAYIYLNRNAKMLSTRECGATCRGFASEGSLPDRLARVSPSNVNVARPRLNVWRYTRCHRVDVKFSQAQIL